MTPHMVKVSCPNCADMYLTPFAVKVHLGHDGLTPQYVCTCPMCSAPLVGSLNLHQWQRLTKAGAQHVLPGQD